MCTPHVRVNKQTFDTVIELLEQARKNIVNCTSMDSTNFSDALDAQLAVQSAMIHLEVIKEPCFFESGFTFPDVQQMSDEVHVITYHQDFSQKSELPAEVSPELAIS